MPGIVALIGTWPEPKQPPIEFRSIRPLAIKSRVGENYFVEQFVNPKFPDDKVFYDDDEVLIALDGVVLNIEELRRERRCRHESRDHQESVPRR